MFGSIFWSKHLAAFISGLPDEGRRGRHSRRLERGGEHKVVHDRSGCQRLSSPRASRQVDLAAMVHIFLL